MYIEPAGEDRKEVFVPAGGSSLCGKCYLYKNTSRVVQFSGLQGVCGVEDGVAPGRGLGDGVGQIAPMPG